MFVERLHAPAHIQSTTVELTSAEFAKLAPVVGEPMIPGEDLVVLEDISEATILHNLRLRLQKGDIFTAIGPVLVVVNPYEPVKCCSDKEVEKLSKIYASDPQAEPPHAHKITVAAYRSLIENTRGGGAQAILVSGESGAGKTETTKLCMSCLAQISSSSGDRTDAALESSFLLEAFGNARTVYNHNSSRFGKWCAVHFDDKNKIRACNIESYLLEQSRIPGPAKGERNYHAFYYILKGPSADERKKFGLLSGPGDYRYTKSGEHAAPGIDDEKGWSDMKAKFKLIGFDDATSDWVFSMIAAVLTLGNIDFEEDKNAPKGEETWMVKNPEVATQLAAMLKLPNDKILKDKLTSRVMSTGRGSTYTILLSESGTCDARDALAKALYSALFDWFISKLNVVLGGTELPKGDLHFIGFLDIFGFENFTENGFEQLCINYTNEKLQSHFTDALIIRQQEEYKREGVTVDHIVFPNNNAQIELLDGVSGIFAKLDEECVVPKGSELGYVNKLHGAFEKNALYSKPVLGKNGSIIQGKKASDNPEGTKISFIVKHYAGEVLYTASDWLEKNRGALRQDLVGMMQAASDPMVAGLFEVYKPKSPSVGFVYRSSLRSLSDTMATCNQHFIRCLKPNMEKVPGLYNGQVMTRQLAYTGCTAVVEIQRSGYPVSFVHSEFVRQYRCIAFDAPKILDETLPSSIIVKGLLEYAQQLAGGTEDLIATLRVQVGKTKVFMRDDVLRILEAPRREVVGRAATSVQRYTRGYLTQQAMGNVTFHRRAVVEIRAAIEKRDTKEAEAKVAELQTKWDGCTLEGPMVGPLKRQLVALKEEVEDLKNYRKFAWDSGDRYEGAWKNGDMNGKGTYYYADGNLYEGQWKEGNRQGEGTLTWFDGQQYTGQWKDDTMSGLGKYCFLNGSIYHGEYTNGLRQGKGKFTYADGGIYEGDFVKGKKSGHGTYTDPRGVEVYVGQWQDKEHGEGKFVFPNGEIYEGQFVQGKKEGHAVYTEPSGNKYEGAFVAGKRQGQGKYTYPDGSIAHEGLWEDGQPVN